MWIFPAEIFMCCQSFVAEQMLFLALTAYKQIYMNVQHTYEHTCMYR